MEDSKTITLNVDNIDKLAKAFTGPEKDFEIKGATINDLQCSYSYELLTGKTKGDIISRKGMHVIHDDLQQAMSDLDVFLAHLDGAFAHWATNKTTLEELEAPETLQNYHVSSFKISGVEENRSVLFSGSKYVAHGTIKFDAPKIKFNGIYLYMEELESRLDKAIAQVEAYMNGKSAPQLEQQAIDFDNIDQGMADFDSAKVN